MFGVNAQVNDYRRTILKLFQSLHLNVGPPYLLVPAANSAAGLVHLIVIWMLLHAAVAGVIRA
eukprot:scaffold38363_cov14-Tisochrysis_lutea.AAC.1